MTLTAKKHQTICKLFFKEHMSVVDVARKVKLSRHIVNRAVSAEMRSWIRANKYEPIIDETKQYQ